ncbi:hypothetical protein CB0101_08770 [Synechococcus sp. CB0101]|uniref:hypothetical protein n=1 Tax=Synechococcus sp. CB0101 TaxID=232348 RepID=UPI0002001C10|nr:hypothetical protein [Synechococcus sp. CB0101]QCH15010.1 hypothetical protein CB0101_08770 [Synechococcus sp. CB0101]
MQPLRQQPAALLILGLLLAGIAHGLFEILALAQAHWAQPNLFGDSFAFVQRSAEPGWLTAQHNEHRILWAKAASVVETELLKLPPGQSALFQNLALILGCAGLWSWLCRRLLHRSDLCLITALAGGLLLINPWQYENLGWEFQTPWFLINALVLLGTLLLSVPTEGRWPQGVAAAGLPWLALSSTGQGLAVAVAFTACAWLHSRRLSVLVTASTALASLTCFVLLPYSKPAGHPELNFQLDYFLRAWLGGPWQGLAVLAVVIAAVLLGRRQPIAQSDWPALLMPGLFSVLFAGMITLSRAGFGVEQANSSRYISHSLMLGLTALLALALADDRSKRQTTPLLGGFLVLLTTIGSFPQGLQAGGLSYAGAWAEGKRWSEQKRQRFICHAEQASLDKQNLRLLEPCKEIHPRQRMVDRYFQGVWPVKPLGWHQELLSAQPATSGAIRHQLDQQTPSPASLRLQGWAFLTTAPHEQLYLLADYGTNPQLAIPVNQPRRDVKRAHHLANKNVGFDAAIPRNHNGQPLKGVRVGTPTKAVQIWEDPSADG